MFRAESPRPAAVPADTRARWHRDREEPPPGVLAPAALAGLAALTALWPFTAVIAPGTWSFVATVVIIAVVGVGALVRHLLRGRSEGIAGLLALLAQVIVAVGALTLLLAGDTAIAGVVPTRRRRSSSARPRWRPPRGLRPPSERASRSSRSCSIS